MLWQDSLLVVTASEAFFKYSALLLLSLTGQHSVHAQRQRVRRETVIANTQMYLQYQNFV